MHMKVATYQPLYAYNVELKYNQSRFFLTRYLSIYFLFQFMVCGVILIMTSVPIFVVVITSFQPLMNACGGAQTA